MSQLHHLIILLIGMSVGSISGFVLCALLCFDKPRPVHKSSFDYEAESLERKTNENV